MDDKTDDKMVVVGFRVRKSLSDKLIAKARANYSTQSHIVRMLVEEADKRGELEVEHASDGPARRSV